MPTREDLVRTLIGGAAALIVAICLISARDWLDNINLALRLERSRRRARLGDYALQRVHRISELVVNGAPLSEVVHAVRDELTGELRLRDVGFVPGDLPSTHHVMGHNGIVEGQRVPSGVTLADQLALALHGGGRRGTVSTS